MTNVLNIETMHISLLKMNQDLTNRLMMRFTRYHTLTDRNYEIVRSGSGFETAYDIEPDEVVAMDLNKFAKKMYDMELFLLEEADRYHGTDYAEEYKRGSSGNTLDDDSDTRDQNAAAERKARKSEEKIAKEAEFKAKFGDPDTDPLPWEDDDEDSSRIGDMPEADITVDARGSDHS